MYGLETRGNHPPLLQAALPSLQWPPPEPQQTASIPVPAMCGDRVLSLEAQGLLLVPRPRSRITGPPPPLWKDPLFNMFTMAALKPHRFSVFALLFISFPSLLLAQDVFKSAHDNVVSLVCAWRVKIKYKRFLKKAIKCLQVLCRKRAGNRLDFYM